MFYFVIFLDYILDQRKKLKQPIIYSDLIPGMDEDDSSNDYFFKTLNGNLSNISPVPTKNSSCQTSDYLTIDTSKRLKLNMALRTEKEKVKQLEKTVVLLGRQLTNHESEEKIFALLKKNLSVGLYTMIKSHIH